MSAFDLLATNLNRRDDEPNQKLAEEIISSKNTDWVKELVDHLEDKDKNIQSDCIKVLYEIGERGSAGLIAPYCNTFFRLLKSKNNRLVWGSMIAIDSITLLESEEVFNHLDEIDKIVESGSVITIDHGVSIYAKLTSIEKYSEKVLDKLVNQLEKCPVKQFPMYIEKSEIAMNKKTKDVFLSIIEMRYPELEKDTQRKRIDKIKKKLQSNK